MKIELIYEKCVPRQQEECKECHEQAAINAPIVSVKM